MSYDRYKYIWPACLLLDGMDSPASLRTSRDCEVSVAIFGVSGSHHALSGYSSFEMQISDAVLSVGTISCEIQNPT